MSTNIHSIVRRINRELAPQFEERLRSYLAEHDKEWLIEQILYARMINLEQSILIS